MKTKIAVTYENGEVFQHFGHTKEFKFYTVEDKKIVDSEIVPQWAADTACWRIFCC